MHQQKDNHKSHKRLEAIRADICARFGWRRVWVDESDEFCTVDEQGQLLWIHAGADGETVRTSWDWAKSKPGFPYSALVGIIVAATGELRLVVRVPYSAVERLKHENQANFRLRWNRDTAHDDAVTTLFSADASNQMYPQEPC